ncbi:MAG: four helix bundle protein [Patescibacteria group bacterium]
MLILPPPDKNFSILTKLNGAYLFWQVSFLQMSRLHRYSLGIKIDNLFTETLKLILAAKYSHRDQKLEFINQAIIELDTLKFFLQISWQNKSLDDKKYLQLSASLAEVGKIIGGWKKLF